jgi:citronellol/citronellal dehydrogenase
MQYNSIFRPGLFAGQTIIITGGGTGIGRATAHELAALGAHVVLASRKQEHLERTRDEIATAGGSATAQVCDVRDEAQVAALFEAVLAERGALHGLFNNGGGQFLSPAEQISLRGWQAVVETNLTGTFLMCREAFKRGMGQHGGAIVNMLIDHWRGFPGMAHSAAARAGVENLTRTLAVEWARAGVRVNAVAPGVIRSSGLERYGEAARPFLEQARQDIPAKRMGTESEVASVVTFLLSPAASYISGATIRIDGGSGLWRKTWEIPDHDRAPEPFDGFADVKRET